MSVQELRLATQQLTSVRVNSTGNLIFLTVENKQGQALCGVLNRNDAYLLYLFLKERFDETGRDDTFDNYPLEI